MPLVMMVVVIVLITVAYLHFHQGQSTAPTAASPGRQDTASSSASPTLGPWKHITTRADDPKALSLTELFPRQLRRRAGPSPGPCSGPGTTARPWCWGTS